MQHLDVVDSPLPDSDPMSALAALERELDTLLCELRHAQSLQPRIAELEQVMHKEFERGGGWQGRSTEEVAAFCAKTGPQRHEMNEIQERLRRTVERVGSFGEKFRQCIVDMPPLQPQQNPR
jgi:hypothetical protein